MKTIESEKLNEAKNLILNCQKGSITMDGSFGQELSELAYENDWNCRETYSRCSVASVETQLKNKKLKLEIIEACCFGTFTEIKVW